MTFGVGKTGTAKDFKNFIDKHQAPLLPNLDTIRRASLNPTPGPSANLGQKNVAPIPTTTKYTPANPNDYSFVIDAHKSYNSLNHFYTVLKDRNSSLDSIQKAFLDLEKIDKRVFEDLCYFIYSALKDKEPTYDQFGRKKISNSPMILLQITNDKHETLIEQLLAFYKGKENHLRAIAQLKDFRSHLNESKFSDSQLQEEFKKLDPKLCLDPICKRIYEADADYRQPQFGIDNYGYNKAVSNIRSLLEYISSIGNTHKYIYPIDEIIDQYQSRLDVRDAISVNNFSTVKLRQDDNYDIITSLTRAEELILFRDSLKNPYKTSKELIQQFRNLSVECREALGFYVWLAGGLQDVANYGNITIEEDLKTNRTSSMFLHLKTGKNQFLLDELIQHFEGKVFVHRVSMELSEFALVLKNPHKKIEEKQKAFTSLSKEAQNLLGFKIWNFDRGNIPINQFQKGNLTYGFDKIYKQPSCLLKDKLLDTVLQELEQIANYSVSDACEKTKNMFQGNTNQPSDNIGYERLKMFIKESDLPKNKRIAQIAAEFPGLAAAGGLGPAVLGICEAETVLGHKVRMILPNYKSIKLPPDIKARCLKEKTHYKAADGKRKPLVLNDHFGEGKVNKVYRLKFNSGNKIQDKKDFDAVFKNFAGNIENITFYLIDDTATLNNNTDHFNGAPYSKTGPYPDELPERFAYFSSCAAELASILKTDLVHCHDWHTAGVPYILAQRGHQEIPTVFTFHNNLEQGKYETPYGVDLMEKMGLDKRPTNMMIEALKYATEVTTVSKSFAQESQTPQFGEGIHHEVRKAVLLGNKLTGIVNGANVSQFDPSKDVLLKNLRDPLDPLNPVKTDLSFTSADALEKKRKIAEHLSLEFAIHYPHVKIDFTQPIVLFIGRYDLKQKGIEMLRHAMDVAIANKAQLVVMGVHGSSDDPSHAVLEDLKKQAREQGAGVFIVQDKRRPSDNRLQYQEGPNPDPKVPLSDEDIFSPQGIGSRFRAIADIVLVPSKFEPCGLVQLEAYQYGSFPFARAVGGLRDTILSFAFENGVDEKSANAIIDDMINDPRQLKTGFVYEAKEDPNSQEQIEIFKRDLDHFIKFIKVLRSKPEKHAAIVKEIMQFGKSAGWLDSFNGQLPAIEQMMYVYAAALNKAKRLDRMIASTNLASVDQLFKV